MSEMDIDTIVSLRVLGPNIDPDTVSKAMGMDPDECHRLDDKVSKRSDARRKHGYWGLRSTKHLASAVDANDHVDWLVNKVKDKLTVLQAYKNGGSTVDVWLAVHTSAGHGGPTLRADVIARLAALGLDVILDLYPDA